MGRGRRYPVVVFTFSLGSIRASTLFLGLTLALATACGDDDDAGGDAGTGGASGHSAGSGEAGSSGSGAGGGSGVGGASGSSGVGGASGESGSGGRAGDGGGGAGGNSEPLVPGECPKKPLFSANMAWNRPIHDAAKDAESDTIIAALEERGWGAGRLQIDYSIDVLCAPKGTPLRSFERNDDFYEGDCDYAEVPVPADGHLEGEQGYVCESDGDCHLIVIAPDTNKLYEQWRVNIDGDGYSGGCLAVWELGREYGPGLRGDQCSSADAAGLPIAPLLFDADEVAAGEIRHAVRFALPNSHLRNRTYVRPATHATGAAMAGEDGVPYGARLRLRADYPLESLPSEGARVLARALQRYGMILADGGNIALMGQDDRGTTAKWEGLLGPHDLTSIQPDDFEMVAGGERIAWTGDCALSE
jgi:hypothetical protein